MCGVGEAIVLQILPPTAPPLAQWDWQMALMFSDPRHALLLPGGIQPVLNAHESIMLGQEGHC